MHAYDGDTIYLIGGFNGAKDINQFIRFRPETSPFVCGTGVCPPGISNEVIWAILLILAFILILTLFKNYKRRRDKSD
jgi:hypothetical protein